MNNLSEKARFSVDELKQIGWRIKSIRSLTGLNQEEFALSSGIPHMTIKGWELGRALPREIGIKQILLALDSYNIQVSAEWIIFGEGAGPVYGRTSIAVEEQESQSELLIKSFKMEQRKKSANPIIAKISDGLMSPEFNTGDIVGGIMMAVSDVRSKYSSEKIAGSSWLVPIEGKEWIVRDIFFEGESMYVKQVRDTNILKVNALSIGKIVWHYFSGE